MKKLLIFFAAAAFAAAGALHIFAEDGDAPHEHDWVRSSHVDYTCTEDGYDVYVCASCGEEERRVTDPASHRNELKSERSADCENGGEQLFVCSVCGEETVITTPALGHEWNGGEYDKKPTLFTAGREKFTCKRDPSHVKFDKIPSEFSSSPETRREVLLAAAAVLAAPVIAAGIKIYKKKRKKV